MMMRGSSSNMNLDNNATSLQNELELLLLQKQHNHDLIIEKERGINININRSGSAPPTVEGALLAAGSLLRNTQFNSNIVDNDVLTEKEIRSHPVYLEYYYSHENLNPRLPPPLLSKEDWRFAQRVRATGLGLGRVGDWRNQRLVDNGGNTSLFSMQPGVSVQKAENELRKKALRHISRDNSSELLNRGAMGVAGPSSSGMGVRRKSFADILQEGLGQPENSRQLSRPASYTSLGDAMHSISANRSGELQNKTESIEARMLSITQNLGNSFSAVVGSSLSRSGSPESHLGWNPPNSSFVNVGSRAHSVENLRSIASSSLNVPSSAFIEAAASLSGLSMSKDKREAEDASSSRNSSLQIGIPNSRIKNQYVDRPRVENLANYADLTINVGLARGVRFSDSLLDGQASLPKRTSSSTNHQLQLSPSELASLENPRIQHQCSNFPGMSISGDGHANQKSAMINHPSEGSIMSGHTGNGQNFGNSNHTASRHHFPAMDPHQIHYMQKMTNYGINATHNSGNSSQGRCFLGKPQHEGLQALQNAYLEALLLQQEQQYHSHFARKFENINHNNYHHNHPLLITSPTSPYQRNHTRDPTLHNKQSQSTMKSPKAERRNNMETSLESSLEALKKNKTKCLELSDVINYAIEFSMDQYGSRFIQQNLETAAVEEKIKIFHKILPHARNLMTDVFGNYVIQKFLEHGTDGQRTELANQLIGHVLPLSLQMYGCRVIQKALEVVDVELQAKMVAELDGSVMKCVHDQNGNHVIQKCIECVPQDRIEFIISSFSGQVVTLSTHPYGCRVIQRVLEHCGDSNTQRMIMDEIMNSVYALAQDQYGNYVIQHVLQQGKPHERSAIIRNLSGQIVKMSQQKFASNVVEKCLTLGSPEERKHMINQMLGSTDANEPLQAMMKDPFGNYVVQKVLETCDDQSRELILSRIKVHLSELKRYTYGKHIVSRVEKLVATGEKHTGTELSSSHSS